MAGTVVVRELITRMKFKTDKASLNKAEQSIGKVKKGMKLGTVAIVASIGLIGKAIFDAAGDMEMLTTQFEVMLGSAEKAKGMMDELKTFAASTPFALKDLAQGTQTLLSFGVAEDKAIDTMRMLGDTSGGNAEKLKGLVLAYGKVQTKGKASMEEINMMAERGIPIIGTLQKQLGVTEQEFFKMVSAGKIGREEVTQAFRTMTSEGGMFFKGMEKQSLTFKGLISTAKDNLTLMAAEIGESLLPVAKELIVTFTKLVQGPLGDLLNVLIGALKPVLEVIGPLIELALQSLEPLIRIIQVNITFLTQALQGAFEILKPVLGLIKLVFEQVANIMEALQPAISIIIDIVTEVVGLFVQLISGALGDLFTVIGEILTVVAKALSMLMKILGPIIKFILKMVAGALGVALRIIAGIFKVIWNVLKFIWDIIKKIIEMTIQQWMPVIEILGKAFKWLGGIFKKVFGAIGQWWRDQMDEMKMQINELIETFNKLFKTKLKPLKMSDELMEERRRKREERRAAREQQTTTNVEQNNDISITAPVGPGGETTLTPTGVAKVASQAAKSAFNLELKKVLIGAT